MTNNQYPGCKSCTKTAILFMMTYNLTSLCRCSDSDCETCALMIIHFC